MAAQFWAMDRFPVYDDYEYRVYERMVWGFGGHAAVAKLVTVDDQPMFEVTSAQGTSLHSQSLVSQVPRGVVGWFMHDSSQVDPSSTAFASAYSTALETLTTTDLL